MSICFDELIDIYTPNGKKICSKRIGEIKKGEYVKSRDEQTKKDIYVQVLKNHNHKVLTVVEIELSSGKKMKCTLDHKFRTTDGSMFPLWHILKNDLDIVSA